MERQQSKFEPHDAINACLASAYCHAEQIYHNNTDYTWNLSGRFKDALDEMSNASSSASTGFTNIVTGLAIKSAMPNVDIRYHQVQIQNPPLFNFRTISEKIVYPWLAAHDFEGAKSGWQTRTFERPKPYLLNYDENIGTIKNHFLTCYDEVSTKHSDAHEGLSYIMYRQMELREKKQIPIAVPSIDDINTIVSYFDIHFSHQYKSKGASRLPVLAIHAIYSVMLEQLSRYDGIKLKELKNHSSADAQTGSVGDIELEREDGSIFEALEIKHGIKISVDMIDDYKRKIMPYNLERYYVLTTHLDCKTDGPMRLRQKEIKDRLGCQIIINGVIPTIQYYLRLLKDPSAVFNPYAELLRTEPSISHEHRVAWNDIVIGKIVHD
jgi:DNA (cytosine-5)-methyltransferase 1